MVKGLGYRKVMLISEKGWHNDHYMVERLINRSGGLDKSQFYFADIYTPNLQRQIRDLGIKVVVGLGEPVLGRLTGERDILRWRGRVLDWDNRYFIPTFAPHKLLPENPNAAYIKAEKARGITPLVNPPRFQGTWMRDVEFALHVAQHGYSRIKANYVIDPSPAEFDQWVDNFIKAWELDPTLELSWDVETAYKQKKKNEDEYEEDEAQVADGTLLRISFSYAEGTGCSVPWMSPYLSGIQRLLGHPCAKIVWNGLTFDIPVVSKVGMEVRGVVYDYMDGFHLYQSDLPKGLEFVSSYTSDLLPWKHLNHEDPGLYSAIDSDAALRNAHWLKAKLHHTGQWGTFLNHYVRLMPALHKAGKRGTYIHIPTRDAMRQEMSELMDTKVAELQPLVPFELLPRKRYLRCPYDGEKDFSASVLTEGAEAGKKLVSQDGRTWVIEFIDGERKFCTACNQEASNKSEHFKGGKKNPCKAAGASIEVRKTRVSVWDEVLPFNPNSGDQLKSYARHFGHPIGEAKDDSEKESMDANHLKLLAKSYAKHKEFYTKVLEVKKLRKTLGTYVYDPDEEGLIHTTYKNAPSTPRLSSANKNLQNLGNKEDANYWAVRAKEQLIARPGHRFVHADSSAIEAVMQGWWMGDEQYMRLATQSIHAWVVAMEHGIPWEGTPEQVAYIKENFKNDYNKMKTTNYLTNFGGGPYLMWKTFPEVFPTKDDAERSQNRLYEQLPKLKEFHHWVRTKAQKESYLELPGWKHRHYYYDVFSVDRSTGRLKLGKDAKRVCAFFPQGGAACFMRDNTLLLAYGDEAAEWLGIPPLGLGDGYLRWFPANYVVHDGYTLEPPDGKEDEVAEAMEKVLTRPIPQLSGLRVGCEVDIGPVMGNWAPYHEVRNPTGLKTVKVCRVEVVTPPATEVRWAA